MSGVITINFKVMKNGMADLGMKSPLYLPGPVEPHYGPGRYLTFEGFSVDHHGKQVCGVLFQCSSDTNRFLTALHGRYSCLSRDDSPLY
jgi:acetamidase/formamidase